MEAVTGKAIVTSMMRLATEMSSWKKAAKDGDDGRKIYISLTAKGESAVQEMVELLAETAAVVFDCMDAHRRMQIYTKVQELLELFNTGGWKE